MSHIHFQPLFATERMLLAVSLAAVIFWLADRRWHLVTKFVAEKRTPLDLAVIRIVLMAWLMQTSVSQALVFAQLDPALVYPPTGWGRLALMFPRNPHLIHGAYVVFLVSAVFALIGLWTRVSVPLAAAGAFYLMTIPQLFGKINHGHHLILFAILLAFSPCGDALSADALLSRRKGAAIPVLERSKKYAAPLNAMIVLMGIIYFFPGVWKVARNGLHWFSSSNLQNIIGTKLLEDKPTAMQSWVLHQPALLLLASIGTIVFEVGWIFFAVNKRTRPFLVVCGLAFHNMTGLLMNIFFTHLQICYVVLVDWGHVVCWLAPRFGRVVEKDGIAPMPLASMVSLPFKAVAGVIIAAMVMAGMLHAQAGWPIACYPTFDTSDTATLREVSLQAAATNGEIYRQTLSFDPLLQQQFAAPNWQGMVNLITLPGRPVSEQRVKAIVQLWQAAYHRQGIYAAQVYVDTYDLSKDPSYPFSHKLLADLQLDR
jgi:Vitamin K-dependent gamma-carboxylase